MHFNSYTMTAKSFSLLKILIYSHAEMLINLLFFFNSLKLLLSYCIAIQTKIPPSKKQNKPSMDTDILKLKPLYQFEF